MTPQGWGPNRYGWMLPTLTRLGSVTGLPGLAAAAAVTGLERLVNADMGPAGISADQVVRAVEPVRARQVMLQPTAWAAQAGGPGTYGAAQGEATGEADWGQLYDEYGIMPDERWGWVFESEDQNVTYNPQGQQLDSLGNVAIPSGGSAPPPPKPTAWFRQVNFEVPNAAFDSALAVGPGSRWSYAPERSGWAPQGLGAQWARW